ncbi:MoaD/ThiS family protein [Rhodopirellula halodulae]|uniref:MoaD/ThiS family protein n=1 Tax=Rhodopirellula halodulae TaxID=2894198 RepID=UPI001E41FFB4|nr:MoaD/ThiS family protein [Rhodopirellula sp. JC737]MCC9658148.1 MoaD/ThiS family protein [Rhodopirellula sp. JC737]
MSPPRKLEVLLFAGACEAAGGVDRVTIDSTDEVTAGELLQHIAEQHPALAGLTQRSRLAVNQKYVGHDEPVDSAAEIALIPPVSGG